MCWFKETADFDESEDKTKMLSFLTGLISQKGKDNVNAEDCFSVGTALQKDLMARALSISFEIKSKSKIDPTKEDSEGEQEKLL